MINIHVISNDIQIMVYPTGLEPVAAALEVRYSIQLS